MADQYWVPIALRCLAGGLTLVGERRVSHSAATGGKCPAPMEAVLSHQAALRRTLRGARDGVLGALLAVSYYDEEACAGLWAQLFASAWGLASASDRAAALPALTAVLAQDAHQAAVAPAAPFVPLLELGLPTRSGSAGRLAISVLTQGIALARPAPLVHPTVLAHVGKTFRAWQWALLALEPLTAACGHLASGEGHVSALADLYAQLSEDDLRTGLVSRYVGSPGMLRALELESHGLWQAAHDEYVEVVKREYVRGGGGAGHAYAVEGGAEALSQFELGLWEERWLTCSRNLCQWPLLKEYAQLSADPMLLAEACSKVGDWGTLRELMVKSGTVRLEMQKSVPAKLYEVEAVLHAQELNPALQVCEVANFFTIRAWCRLPSIPGAAHEAVLMDAQRTVEARETVLMAIMVERSIKAKKMPDLKAVLSVWRERLPNRWEGMVVWDALLTWRHHVFSFVTNRLQQSGFSPKELTTVHDAPWTVIKLAHTSRKLGLHDVCVSTLARLLQLTSMDVNDAYNKLREQLVVCLQRPPQRNGGLVIVNATNLDYFKEEQKAEIFRLKAVLQETIGGEKLAEAHTAFSVAAHVAPLYGKAWLSWGMFLERLFHTCLRGTDSLHVQRAVGAVLHGSEEALSGALGVAVNAITAYLVAAMCDCSGAALVVGRVLWLLTFDNDVGVLNRAVLRHLTPVVLEHDRVRPQYWLPWVPQLMANMARREHRVSSRVLALLCGTYPQGLYYPVRVFLMEAEAAAASAAAAAAATAAEALAASDAAAAAAAGTAAATAALVTIDVDAGDVVAVVDYEAGAEAPPPPPPPPVPAADAAPSPAAQRLSAAEDLLGVLRRASPTVCGDMEGVVSEVARCFVPDPLEDLASGVRELLCLCGRLPAVTPEGASAAGAPVPGTVAGLLGELAATAQAAGGEFGRAFGRAFPGGADAAAPTTLGELMSRLARWDRALCAKVRGGAREARRGVCHARARAAAAAERVRAAAPAPPERRARRRAHDPH